MGPNAQFIQSMIERITTLLDVLNAPLVQIIGEGLPLISIGTKLLRYK